MFEQGSPYRLPLALLVIGIVFAALGTLELVGGLAVPQLHRFADRGIGLLAGGAIAAVGGLLWLWRRQRSVS